MRKIKLLTALLAFFLFMGSSYAQVSTYSFSGSSGTYTPITGGTVHGTTTNDDGSFNAIDLGFSFVYNGAAYSQISINTNGFIGMGASVVSSTSAISGGTSNNIIAALNRDLQGQTGSELMSLMEGTAPNRVFTIQWSNYRSYGATGDIYNFQIKLYETTNLVSFVYGAFTPNATARTMQVGLRGASSADYNNRTTTTDWAATAAGAVNTATCALSTTVFPTSGLTYTFTPPSCSAPSGITVSGTTSTSTNISWTAPGTGSPVNYEWLIVLSGAGTGGTPQASGTVAHPLVNASASGLTPSTAYHLYVRTFCGGSDYSGWAGPVAFTTPCNSVSVFPWTEGFETVTIPAFPSCWYKENGDWVTTNNASSTYDANARTGAQFLRETYSATNEYVWSPGFDLVAGTSYDFSFWWAGDNYNGWTGDIFYNTTQISTGATQLGTSFIVPATAQSMTYEQAKRTFVPSVSGTYYFGIRVTATSNPWYLSFDDFLMELTPACVAPTTLTASNIADVSADLGWTEAGSATSWNVEVGAVGFTPGTGTAVASVSGTSSNPWTATGLSASTSYVFYVQSICGGPTSTWAGPFAFNTSACPIANQCNFSLVVNDSYGDGWNGASLTVLQNGVAVGAYSCSLTTNSYSITLCNSSNIELSWTSGAYDSECSFTLTSPFGSTVYTIANASTLPDGVFNTFTSSCIASTETDIITYSFPEQTGPATIDAVNHTVAIEVGNGTNMAALTATFTLSTGATAAIGATPQVSATTVNDFSSPVTYTVTAEDGTTTQNWVVTVTEAVVNTETDILTFSFPEQTGAATINPTAHTIAVEIEQCADITTLIADFTLSFGADAEVATVAQTSGVTVNDFTAAITYTITAEDGTTTQDWVVTVTQVAAPAETVCASAFAYDINDPAYTNSLCPNTPLYVAFTLDQDYDNVVITTDGSGFDTQLAYFNVCGDIVDDMTTSPANPTNNLGYDDDSGIGTQSMITETSLAAGTYIAVIYGYGTASGDVQFTVTGTPPPAPALTWSATTFTEAAANDGSISTVVDLTLVDETFATVGTLVEATDYTVANVPAGLTVSIVTTSTTTATVALTGNAAAHENINDIANMGITFLDAAFTGGVAANVDNYTQTALIVDFEDAPVITLIINEVDADQTGVDGVEFIELYDGGVGNTSLNGFVVVLYNGSSDLSYDAIDLDGYSTDANGYFVIGSATVPNVDMVEFTTDGIQNGQDAVALYMDNATTFPTNTPVTATNIIDALVYDTDDVDDPGLLALLNAGQPQINENGTGNKDLLSCSRIANGTGGALNTSTYVPAIPTPGAANNAVPVITWSATEFDEDFANDGSISTVVNLTLADETFATVGALTEATHYTVANVPAGLTVLITTTSTTTATVELTGNAAVHMNADDVANMGITFLDAAFTFVPANLITGYTQTALIVDYIDVAPAYITWTGTVFTEAAANDGACDDSQTLTLTNDTYAFIGTLTEGVHYTTANVPTGLTVDITATDANNAVIILPGNAVNHANIDDVNNMTITFLDAAFTTTLAADVVESSHNDLVVDFNDPAMLSWDATTFVEDVANDGSIATVVNLTLSGETFATTGVLTESTDYTVANVPAGLAVLITATTNTATVELTGNATSHENIDDIANMEITFLDAAFSSIAAADVVNSSQTALAVDFMDVALLTDLAIIFPEAINYVCDFDGTDTVPIGIMNIGETVIATGETIDIFYTLDGGTTVVSDVITLVADLNPGEYVVDLFDAEENFAPGTYDFTIWFEYTADENAVNNTLDGQVISYHLIVDLGGINDTIEVATYPYTLDAHSYPYSPVYLWQDGSTNQTLEVNADGWYSVEVTDDNGCYSMDSVYVYLFDAVSEIDGNVSVTVYPNPNKGVFTVEYTSNVSENITIEIMNVQGQVVLSDKANADKLTRQYNIEQFADGVYYLKLTTETQNMVKKIVVQ